MSALTIRLTGTIVLAIVLSGCASVEVSSYVDRGINMRQLRTYNWTLFDQRATGDPRLDNNRFFHEHVRAAIEQQLGRKGFEKAAVPDVLIQYHASITQEVYTAGGVQQVPYCDECRPEVFDAGTLVIDVIDPRTNRLMWRGWAKGSFDGVVNDQAWMERKIDDAVARILRRL